MGSPKPPLSEFGKLRRSGGSDRSADAAVDTSLAVSESVVEHASPPTEGPSYLRPRPDEDAGSVRSATSESRRTPSVKSAPYPA